MPRIAWRRLKQAPLRAMKIVGGFDRLLDTAWRRKRLLILCYHGVSIDDEHEWNPGLYLPQDDLRWRLGLLRASRCAVLPLAEAVERLYAGTLPTRSVALTFDDGFFDFYSRAYPVLREFEMPATVYLTTLRCENNRPIFGLICSYVIWKGRGRVVNAPEAGGVLDLRTEAGRAKALAAINGMAARERLTITQKDELAAHVAARCDVDYAALAARRLLTIMTPAEVTALAAAGIDFELHTHTHRAPVTPDDVAEEITRNRASIERMTQRSAVHFCYPSGDYRRELLPSLAEHGVVSATTCDPGLASPTTHPLLLPRFVDTTSVGAVEFEAWVSGAATFVSRNRSYAANAH